MFESEFGGEDLGEFGGEDLGEGDPSRSGDRPSGDRLTDANVVHIMVVWGRIRPNDTVPPTVTHWDPQIAVAEGDALAVRSTLRFERGDRVLPGDARNQVALSSTTLPHVDGVILQVAIPAEDLDDAFLSFSSTPLSILVPAVQLRELNESHVIDEVGNRVMLVALEQPVDAACAQGFMAGRWARTRLNGGVFGGEWRNQDGSRTGHLAGRYGVNDAGEQVFHGKVIGEAGEFRALLSGNWADGTFWGQAFGRDGAVIGSLRGHTASGPAGGHGLFRGVWRAACGEPLERPDPEATGATE